MIPLTVLELLASLVMITNFWSTGALASCTVNRTIQHHVKVKDSFSFEMLFTGTSQKITLLQSHQAIPTQIELRRSEALINLGEENQVYLPLSSSSWEWKRLTLQCKGVLALMDDDTGRPWIPLGSLFPCQSGVNMTLKMDVGGATTNCRQGTPVWSLDKQQEMAMSLDFINPPEQPIKFQVTSNEDLKLKVMMRKFCEKNLQCKSQTITLSASSLPLNLEFRREGKKPQLIYSGEKLDFGLIGWQFQVNIQNAGNGRLSFDDKNYWPKKLPSGPPTGIGPMAGILGATFLLFVGLISTMILSVKLRTALQASCKEKILTALPLENPIVVEATQKAKTPIIPPKTEAIRVTDATQRTPAEGARTGGIKVLPLFPAHAVLKDAVEEGIYEEIYGDNKKAAHVGIMNAAEVHYYEDVNDPGEEPFCEEIPDATNRTEIPKSIEAQLHRGLPPFPQQGNVAFKTVVDTYGDNKKAAHVGIMNAAEVNYYYEDVNDPDEEPFYEEIPDATNRTEIPKSIEAQLHRGLPPFPQQGNVAFKAIVDTYGDNKRAAHVGVMNAEEENIYEAPDEEALYEEIPDGQSNNWPTAAPFESNIRYKVGRGFNFFK